MIIKYLQNTFEVPESLVMMYTEDFEFLRDPQMRDELGILRNAVFQLMMLAKKNQKIMAHDQYRKDLVDAFAIREALKRIKLLHDA